MKDIDGVVKKVRIALSVIQHVKPPDQKQLGSPLGLVNKTSFFQVLEQ